jgi:hypothetical protein
MRALAIAALLFACGCCGVIGGRTENSFGTLRLRGGTGRGGPSRGYTSNGKPWRWRHPQTMSLRVRQGLRGLSSHEIHQHDVLLSRKNKTDENLTGLACGLPQPYLVLHANTRCRPLPGGSPAIWQEAAAKAEESYTDAQGSTWEDMCPANGAYPLSSPRAKPPTSTAKFS